MLAADLSALGPDLLPAQYAAGDAPSVRLSFQGPIDVESRDKLNQRIESAKFDGPEIRDALTRAVDQSFGAQESALGARPQVGDVLSQIPSQQTILPQMLGAEMATQLGFEATNWDTVQAESGQSATSVQADPIAGQADRLGRGDLTAFLGSLAIVAGPSRPSQPTNLTANDGRIAVGAFCTASGEEVLPDTLPADSATSDMVGEGEGASDQGSSDSASGSSSSSISVPTFEFPSFEIAKASGNLDDFVPSTQSTTSIVSTHGSFDLSSFTNPDRQADGLNWVHAIDVVWVGPDQWMFTERFLLVFNATASASLSGDLDDLKPDPNRSDSGPTTQTSSGTSTGGSDASSGDTSTGGSDAGSSDAGDGSTGPKLQETGNWSASIEIKRSTFVMFTFIASRGMSTPAAAGVKWSFDGDLSDSISLTASLSGSSTATPAPDSGDGGSGGGSSGTTTGGGSTDGSSQPGDETAPVNDVYANNYESGSSTDGGDDWDLPDDFVAQASWSAALGLTLTAVEGIHVSSTPSLKADGQVERAVALSGNYSFGGNADVDLSWTASSSSGNLIPTGGGATSPWWSPGGPTTPLPEGGDLGLDLIDVEPAIRNFDPEDPQPFNPLGDYDGYGHAMTASTGLRAAIGGAINGSFDLQGILRQGTWAEAAGHVSALLDSSFDFSGDDQFLFVFIPEPTTTPTTPHGTVTTNAKLMLRWDYTQSGDEELDASSAAELAATSDGSLGWVGSDGSILATSATGSTTDSTFDQDASSSNDAADTDVLGVDGEDLLDGEATLSGTGEFDGFDFLILNVEVIGQENWDIETGEQTQFGPIFSTGTRNNTARLDYYGANFGRGDGSYQAMASAVSDATASLSAGVGGEGYAVLDILATGGSTLSEREHANYTDIWERDAEDNSLLHLRFIDEWSSGGSLSASLHPDDSVSWSGSASADARSSVEYEQHLDSVDQAIVLLGETGWDYHSLRDASFQRTANWNALFNPYTGRFDESFTVSGDDEVHLTGYQYHPTNGAPWEKTPLEEALEELYPLDYLDASGDSHSSPGDYPDGSSDGGDTTWGSYTGWQDTESDEDGDGGSGGLRLFGETWVWPWSEDAAGFLETAKAYARAGARAATGAASGAATGAVSGAVTGAVTGAIVGSAEGGVGAIPGATIGASVGAKSGAISGAISGLISAATADNLEDAARDGAKSGIFGGALGGSLSAGLRVARAATGVVAPRETALFGAKWGTWRELPKVTRGGRVYANINGRLYTEHAIQRMVPKSFGNAPGGLAGRGVPSMVVEEVIQHGRIGGIRVVGSTTRVSKILGDVEVILENGIVISIIRH